MKKKRIKEYSKLIISFANGVFVFGILLSLFCVTYALQKTYNEFEILRIYYPYLLFGLLSTSFFILGLLKFHNELKLNISILLISTGLVVYGFEIYLELSSISQKHSQSRKELAKQMEIEYDTRTKLEVIEDLMDVNIKAYPLHSSSKEFSLSNGLKTNKGRIFPIGGISNVITIGNNESGYFPNMKIDEYGFHNPKNLYKKDKVDIVLIGDSYTEGYSVHSNKTINSFLHELDFSSISLGKSGSGPLIELATIKEYAEPLKPKIVLWMFYENDLLDLEREIKSSILKKYLIENEFSQNLIYRQSEIDSVLKSYIENKIKKIKGHQQEKLSNRLMKVFILTNLRNRINKVFTLTPISNSTYETFNNILKKSNRMISEWGGKLYFVYLPSYHMYSDSYSNKLKLKNELKDRKIVLETANKLFIPIIDIHKEVFEIHPDPVSLFPFRIKGHYNAEGYQLVAKEIVERLQKDEYYPIKPIK